MSTPERGPYDDGNRLRAGMFLGLLSMAVSPLAAPFLAAGHPLAAWLIRDFFAGLCHQKAARSFMIYGSPVAVCARCLGIYVGVAAGSLLAMRRIAPVRWLGWALGINLLEWVTGWLGWHGNLPLSRLLLGMLLGISVGALVFPKNLRVAHSSEA